MLRVCANFPRSLVSNTQTDLRPKHCEGESIILLDQERFKCNSNCILQSESITILASLYNGQSNKTTNYRGDILSRTYYPFLKLYNDKRVLKITKFYWTQWMRSKLFQHSIPLFVSYPTPIYLNLWVDNIFLCFESTVCNI